MSNYEIEYASILETAFNFLFRKGKSVNGSPLNQARHEFVISGGGCCLHCGKKLTRNNSNTEHIHDRALGGPNASSNKIIMCTSCNLARNATMQQYLGVPSYWRGFPGNWDRVKKYLLWNAVTVDKGHQAGINYPEVHAIFESINIDNNNTLSPPDKWYGRGNQSNLIINMHNNRNGFWIRVFDKIFGYESSSNNNSMEVKPIAEEGDFQNEKKIAKVQNKREILELKQDFYQHILTALSYIEGEIKLATFSNRFQDYLVEKGFSRQSLKQFAHSYGIPKRRTFIEIIHDYFPEDIQYRREGETMVYIWTNNRGVFECLADEDE